MELVYLWVKDYKNIHNQGFNFSPKSHCHYDEDSNELTIDENDDYIENFFGENINVTAIVGKNGSGKSSIVKLIYLLIYLHKFRNMKTTYWQEELEAQEKKYIQRTTNIFNILTLYDDVQAFLILKSNALLFKIDLNSLKNKLADNGDFVVVGEETITYIESIVNFSSSIVENYKDDINSFFIYFNNSIDILKDNEYEGWIDELYHRKDSYQIPLLVEPAKYNDKFDISMQQVITNQRVLLFYQDIKECNVANITMFFNPNLLKFQYTKTLINATLINKLPSDNDDLYSDQGTAQYASEQAPIIDKIVKSPYKIIGKYLNWIRKDKDTEDLLGNMDFSFLDSISALYQEEDYESINLLYIAFKSSEKSTYINDDAIQKLNSAIDSGNIKNICSLIRAYIDSDKLLNCDISDYHIKKIAVAIEFYKKQYHTALKDYQNKEILLVDLPDDILNFFPAWLEVEVFEDKKSFSSLSTGEKFKFNFIISLLYQLGNLSQEAYSKIYLFFDEVEMGFHPEWQKSFLHELILTLREYSKTLKISFLTHSPFLLSDIPKQNIIFLDKDENGNCKVVDGLKEKKETFGANIHTLLSDSFFMEDGLMGEFAKGKINEIIEFHKEVEEESQKKKPNFNTLKERYKKFKTKFWDIQSIIGEDYLQQVIKNHLRDTESLLGYKEAREEEIKRLRAEADRLESLS